MAEDTSGNQHYPGVNLRVTPEAIPALRGAFEKAIARVGPAISRLGQYGHIPGPWMGDPKSAEVVAFYNERVMDAADGPYRGLVLYQLELLRIRDQLKMLEEMYQQMEADSGRPFGSVL